MVVFCVALLSWCRVLIYRALVGVSCLVLSMLNSSRDRKHTYESNTKESMGVEANGVREDPRES